MKKCPFCGADIEESARFCLYCMQSLTEKEQIFPRRKKKPQWWLTVVAIAITPLILAAAWFGIQIALGNGTPSDTSSVGGSVHTPAAAVKEKYIDSSCTETGSYDEVVYCSVCEEELSRTQKTVDKKPHNYNQKVTTTKYLKTEATETSPAVYYYSCSCGAKGTNTFTSGGVLEHTHSFNQKDTSAVYRKSPATCTELAVYYYSCTCGEKGSTTFTSGELSEHVYDQRNTDVIYRKSQATETSPAVYYYSCACGAKGTNTFTSGGVLGHTHSFNQKDTAAAYRKSPATCTELAVYYYSCVCGEKGSATFTSGTVLPHIFSGWIVDTVATCVEPGKRHHVCTVCQESVSETYSDPNAHSYDTEWAADDIYHWHACSRCNSIKDKKEHLLDDNGKCSLCAHQTTVSNNGFVYMISEDGTYAEIVDYTASKTSVVIAATYKDIPVIKIGSSAFQGKNITSVDIPNSVTSIGSSAFSGCALTDVTIPDSVTRIGDYAFCNCDSLVSINYNGIVAQWQSITKYSNWDYNTADYTVFCTDGQITKDGTVTYSKAASEGLEFALNSDGESYSVEGIGTCTDTYIVIPSTHEGKAVTSIGDNAFAYRDNIESIMIPNGITSIGEYAFYVCRNLKNINIPDGVTSIGYHAFHGCTSLARITIPGSVTSIADCAFFNCPRLESITIPDGITSIGMHMFSDCTSLASITIPDSVTSIDYSAFSGCSNLKSVYITDIVAWLNMSFDLSKSNPCAYGADLYLNGEKLTDLVIPDSITSIGDHTFYGCTSIESIIIPDGVTNIEWNAFSRCTSLASITIPDSVTSIGDEVFKNCTSLASVTIGNSVTSIGGYAFQYCKNLVAINYRGTISQWNDIYKAAYWNNYTGSYTVYCIDGKITQDGTVTYY